MHGPTDIFWCQLRRFSVFIVNSHDKMIRVGLVGCGDIGRLRADAIRQTAGMRLSCVSDIDVGRAQQFAGIYSADAESNWKTLVTRADVDMVIVSTPPSLHATMATESLHHGKHVLWENPLARTPDECRSIVDAAEKSHCVLATVFNYRFHLSIQKARELLASGIIGQLDHIRSCTGYSTTAHSHGWMRDSVTMGGGALRDNGIHLIDLTCHFLGTWMR